MIDVVTISLLAILSLKIVSITRAIFWLARHGKNYAKERRSDGDERKDHFYELFEKHYGKYFPFGMKDYRLRRLINKLSNGHIWHKGINIPLKVFQAFLYRFERLTFIIAIYCAFVVPLSKTGVLESFFSYNVHCGLITAMVITLIFANIILSIEAAYSYGVLGSYATSFHMLSPKTDEWSGGSSFLLELRILVGKLITTTVAGATAFYVTHISYMTLGGYIEKFENNDPVSAIIVFLQSIYFALTTLLTVGYGDIFPITGLGQLVSFLVQLQSFALLGIVLTTIAAIASSER